MNIHVISLRRTPERLAHFLRTNPGLTDFTVCDAIDGHSWQPADQKERAALLAEGLHYSRAAIGCALSHRALWIRCLVAQQPITICEDDALLHKQFQQLSTEFLQRLTAEWDIVMWAWNLDAGFLASANPDFGTTYMKFDAAAVVRKQETYRSTPVSSVPMRVQMAFGSCCYSVSPAGAEKLLKSCFPLKPFDLLIKPINRHLKNIGIDVAMNALYPSMQVWAPFPPLALTMNDKSVSTIQTGEL